LAYGLAGSVFAAFLVISVKTAPNIAAAITLRGVKMAAILSPSDFGTRGWNADGGFDVTASGVVLLQTGGMIVNAVTGASVMQRPRADLWSFTTVRDGLVAVCGQYLCTYDGGTLTPALRLPVPRMTVTRAAIGDTVYLTANTKAGADIYELFPGGSYSKLAHLDQPVFAVAGTEDRVLIASGTSILTCAPGEDPAVIAPLGPGPVTSLAVDPKTGLVMFSTGEGVFALVNGKVIAVIFGMTGQLHFSGQVLLIEDRIQHTLVAVSGIYEAVLSQKNLAAPPRSGS